MSLWQGKRHSCKRQEGLGDFTFLYTVWFYCVHLLKYFCPITYRGRHGGATPTPTLNLNLLYN
ncbi:MAG: hypothetical protein HEQ20_04510 [Aphanizomenon flos-aquae KM1D3_PB]|uniref:hypothetical protein n=1 Tax=Aphanizomenon flos-aquae TaxID=1176 RepID=UPI00190F7B34|nr:hypothetical protein [Aphanizomenon flos-aquae]QSV69345.1 MAG: hypothetical protein HEQ20_04510 [Aphanizomenon flos-aquae KM1D3_PB]